jgi:Flp pilus assembly protein TadG
MASLTRTRLWRSESGAQIVEFALVVPFLLMLIAGIIDVARLFQSFEVATNAAREGARLASLPGYDLNGYATAKGRVTAYMAVGGATGAHATAITPVVIPVGGGATADGVQVTVTYTHDFILLGPVIGLINGTLAQTFAYQTRVTMRTELQAGAGGAGGGG